MKNKADSRMISPWFFLILGLIVLVISIGVFSYFSQSMDTREREAKVLFDKLVYGISEEGLLKDGIFDNYDIMDKVDIDPKSMKNEGRFYFNISIYEGENLKISFLKGNSDFEIQCRLKGKNLAKCYYNEFFLVDKKNSLYKIKILTGVN